MNLRPLTPDDAVLVFGGLCVLVIVVIAVAAVCGFLTPKPPQRPRVVRRQFRDAQYSPIVGDARSGWRDSDDSLPIFLRHQAD